MSVGRIGVLICGVVLAGLAAPAQQTAPEIPTQSTVDSASPSTSRVADVGQDAVGPVPTLHTTARMVVLDVVVTDGKGHSVKGLKSSDFALTEDGVAQFLTSFTEHDGSPLTPAATDEAQLPPNTFAVREPISGDGPKTVIVLANVAWGDAEFVRSQIREYVKTSTPSLPIAIFRIDWQGLHMVQGLTADRKVLQEAANSQRIYPPLGFPVRYARVPGSPVQHLASYLATMQGRVNLVWFGTSPPVGRQQGLFPDMSSGIPPDLAVFMRSTAGGVANVHRLSRIAVYPIPTGGLSGNFDADGNARDAYAAGLGMSSCQEIMELAIEAGGKAFCNTNGFKEALAEVDATGSHYYTLSYRPTNPDWNGAFRKIKVDVDTGESSFEKFMDWLDLSPRAVYRDGYFAREPRDGQNNNVTADSPPASARAMQVPQRKLISVSPRGDPGPAMRDPKSMARAMAFGTLTPTQVHFAVVVTPEPQTEKTKSGADLPRGNYLTGPFRDGPYRNYHVHYWVDPQDLRFTRTANGSYRDDLEFVNVVYRDDGLPANSITYAGPILVAADDLERVELDGVTFDQTIAMPSEGNFFLRAGVHETSTGHIGALEVPAEWIKPVPALKGQMASKPTQ